MSLPPVIVRVKRKATDEAPPELLRVHELGNKRRTLEYVFSLQVTPSIEQSTPPTIQNIHQSDNTFTANPSIKSPGQKLDAPPGVYNHADHATPPTKSATPDTLTDRLQTVRAALPRRFHISRGSTPSGVGPSGGIHKRKIDTVFIERRVRPKSAGKESPPKYSSAQETDEVQSSRPQKKPGLAARKPTPLVKATASEPSIAPLRNVRMPTGKVIPWDVTSEQLAAEMQAYALAEIGKNLAASDLSSASKQKSTSSHIQKSQSRFKPKAPALRYAERHPEKNVTGDDTTMMDLDEPYMEEEVDDNSEYIIDTYYRMPAEALGTKGISDNVGFLILDSQPDIDEFYREQDESDEEEEDLDEDENAENHYTADYPDEEVDSEDEFDRNAYNYRNHNASDNEEFDLNDEGGDIAYSDDENEQTRYPWMNTRA